MVGRRLGQELGLRRREFLVAQDAGLLERGQLLELGRQVHGWSCRSGLLRGSDALIVDRLLLSLLLRGLIRIFLLLVMPDRTRGPRDDRGPGCHPNESWPSTSSHHGRGTPCLSVYR